MKPKNKYLRKFKCENFYEIFPEMDKIKNGFETAVTKVAYKEDKTE